MKGPILLTFLMRRFNPFWTLILCIVAVRASRVGLGYGVEPDAWRVARVAAEIADTGNYAVSRFPGYPAHEFGSAALVRFGPVGLNGASTFMVIVAYIFFMQSLARIRARNAIMTAAALTSIPVVFIASVTAKDYVWGLAFILIAHDMILARRPLIAGVALGLAIGTRLTNAMMILPFAILLDDWRGHVGRIEFAVTALLVGAACFAPVAGVYGLSFLQYSNGGGYPSLPLVAYRFGYGVWGLVGMGTIAAAAALTLARRRNRREFRLRLRALHPQDVWGWGLAVALPLLQFFVLPHQPGYVIPALPFVLLLASRTLPIRVLRGAMTALWVSPFFFGVAPGFEPAARKPMGSVSVRAGGREFWVDLAGPSYLDSVRRKWLMWLGTQAIAEAGKNIPANAVIVAGWWQPQLEVQMLESPGKIDPRFVYALDEREAAEAVKAGRPVYTMPGQAGFNAQVRGVDLKRLGAKPVLAGME